MKVKTKCWESAQRVKPCFPLNFLHLLVNSVMLSTVIMFFFYTMFQNELEAMSGQLEQAETKAIQLSQKNSSLESQLADAQVN